MVNDLLNMGLEANASLKDLNAQKRRCSTIALV